MKRLTVLLKIFCRDLVFFYTNIYITLSLLSPMKKLVISFGGSLILQEPMHVRFLEQFRRTLRRCYERYAFIVVCGGGSVARQYMQALRAIHRSTYEQSLAGIHATRMNALFLMQFFGKEANDTLPLNMNKVKANLRKNRVVICGALRYIPESTSDSTAARLAAYFQSEFVNMTDTSGLYTADPRTHPGARLVRELTWEAFEHEALKNPYVPGQHFVLDQKAAVLIRKYRIPTHIIGPDVQQLANIIKGKGFKGTLIRG